MGRGKLAGKMVPSGREREKRKRTRVNRDRRRKLDMADRNIDQFPNAVQEEIKEMQEFDCKKYFFVSDFMEILNFTNCSLSFC